jgi:hypothetical protein
MLLAKEEVNGKRRLVKKEESNRAQAQVDIQKRTFRLRLRIHDTNPKKAISA